MGRLILITGGANSGKSDYALNFASKIEGKKIFIATAKSLDEEMERKIAAHKTARPLYWETVELNSMTSLEECFLSVNRVHKEAVFLIDCLTMWLIGLFEESKIDICSCNHHEIKEKTQDTENKLICCCHKLEDEKMKALYYYFNMISNIFSSSSATVILVTNEIGLGLVPENRLGRLFREVSGEMNKIFAAGADEMYLVVSGYPVKVK